MASLSSYRYVAYPNKFSEEIQDVPTSYADLAVTDAILWQIHAVNTTAGALTLTINDGNASTGYILPTITIAANTAYVISWPEGLICIGGVIWVASGAGIQAAVVGSYKTT